MATLYEIIAELRQAHRGPAGTRTLDLAMSALGESNDNLRLALSRIDTNSLPTGGGAILEELAQRADAEGVADQLAPISLDEERRSREGVDGSMLGIAALLGLSALIPLLLVAVVIVHAIRG